MSDLSNLKKIIQEDYKRKVNSFHLLPILGKDILIGDSMIAFLLMKKYGFESWVNMGIAGDTTLGVLKRLDAVIRQRPKRVILSVGSNDLVLTDLAISDIANQIQEIIHMLQSHNINVYYLLITPVCHSCEHVNPLYIGGRTNDEIIQLNHLIQKTISSSQIIDVYTPLIDSDKKLHPDYSKDGIHLNDLGYQVFSKTIHQALMQKEFLSH